MKKFDFDSKMIAALARIDELESRGALRDLVSDYCLGFDGRDWSRFIAIWHEDAVWDLGPFGSYTGHAGIHNAVYEVLYAALRESHHLTSNLRVMFSDLDHAHGISNVHCMAANHDNVVYMIGATYTDAFERRFGVWGIARRVVTMHYFNSIHGTEMTAPG